MRQIEIKEMPGNQRVWVIRAQGGDYVPHFRHDSSIAIGHINDLRMPESRDGNFYPDLMALKAEIHNKERAKGKNNWKNSARSRFGQVRAFIAEVEIGDLIVTVDSTRLMIGRAVGRPYVKSTPVALDRLESRTTGPDMNFDLRREVKWGPTLLRKNLPSAIRRSITARQTVFNIDRHWESIYHLLYPVFFGNGRLYFSALIKQEDSINNYRVSQFLKILTDMEAVALQAEGESYNNLNSFDIFFERLLENDELRLATTAEFMSPGSIWSYLGVSDRTGGTITILALLYGAIFGVDLVGIQFDGVITAQMREQLMQIFMDRLQENDIETVKNRLQLEIPDLNTYALESSEYDAMESADRNNMLEKEKSDRAN